MAARPAPGCSSARDGNRAFVYSVRDGRVRAVAVTTAAFGADTNALRSAMSRVLKARASAAERKFVPAEAQAKSRMLGRTLAGSADAKTNAPARAALQPAALGLGGEQL